MSCTSPQSGNEDEISQMVKIATLTNGAKGFGYVSVALTGLSFPQTCFRQDLLNGPLEDTQMSEEGQFHGASAPADGGIAQDACAGLQYSLPGYGQSDSQFDPAFYVCSNHAVLAVF